MFHRIDDCWLGIDSWKFWSLVWYLPAYDGATKVALRVLASKAKDDQMEAGPTTQASSDGSVSPAAANMMAGGGLISFAQGG